MSTTTPTPQPGRIAGTATPQPGRTAGTRTPRPGRTAGSTGPDGDGARHDHRPAPPAATVRDPTAMDQVELRDLAHRLGEPVPAQPVVVAAVGDRVVAGLSVPTGVVVFDAGEAGPAVRAALRRHAAR